MQVRGDGDGDGDGDSPSRTLSPSAVVEWLHSNACLHPAVLARHLAAHAVLTIVTLATLAGQTHMEQAPN